MTTRREFLSSLLAIVPASLVRPGPPIGAPPQRTLNDCFIAGFRYHSGPALLGELASGDRFTLVPEPENEHDAHAVRIEFRGEHIGYLPRNQNRAAFHLLVQGAPVRCIATAIDRSAPPWEAVRIRTYIARGR
jgi:hypothetical protein